MKPKCLLVVAAMLFSTIAGAQGFRPPPFAGGIPGRVQMQAIEVQAVGNYALSFTFGDMHRTGIFQWTYLRELAEAHPAKCPPAFARLRGVRPGRLRLAALGVMFTA